MQENRISPDETRATQLIMLLSAFVAMLNETSITVALTDLMRVFGVGVSTVQWLVTGFMLVTAIVVPVTAYIIQRFHDRTIYFTSLGLLVAGALLCGFAPGFGALLAGRLVQAAGTCCVWALTMNTMLSLSTDGNRGSALGLIGLVSIFAPAHRAGHLGSGAPGLWLEVDLPRHGPALPWPRRVRVLQAPRHDAHLRTVPGPALCRPRDPNPNMILVDDEFRRIEPGSDTVGFIARAGHVPVAYFGDPAKTAATFPVVDGVRLAVLGDMGTMEADGTIVLLGRGSMCINSGGEKVYPEEVEQALKTHPAVFDALVAGAPDARFGEKVAAVVQVRPGFEDVATESLSEHCRTHVAGYKIPRSIVLVPSILRSPSGKGRLPLGSRNRSGSVSR